MVNETGIDPAGGTLNFARQIFPAMSGSRAPFESPPGAAPAENPRKIVPAGVIPKQAFQLTPRQTGGRIMSGQTGEAGFPMLVRRVPIHDRQDRKPYDVLAAELEAALAREETYLREKKELSERQAMLAQEFEHRLVNGMQVIASLLSLQSRSAKTPEATDQLMIAARRVASLARVHRRLHLLDHQERVEFKVYLQNLCEDLSALLSQDGSGYAIVVEGADVEIPTTRAIPLGFIVNELVTNAAKYAEGHVTVRIEAASQADRRLSVIDDGPGLPAGFNPEHGNGLGMKIVLSLVQQIGGELRILPGDNGRGTRFTVNF
ncbi:sensor histidine kinase [Rhodoplanes sp. Z2-YC6860]|uniref:sensor histidine kinase n=1 Tax=Rhodoplanes sp. Z2-YC6860 TaxID=674703 RepID=UPI0009FE03CD|nr:sensor histidine kinase [Rhodoplanes sp. Z2-YC6860]